MCPVSRTHPDRIHYLIIIHSEYQHCSTQIVYYFHCLRQTVSLIQHVVPLHILSPMNLHLTQNGRNLPLKPGATQTDRRGQSDDISEAMRHYGQQTIPGSKRRGFGSCSRRKIFSVSFISMILLSLDILASLVKYIHGIRNISKSKRIEWMKKHNFDQITFITII